MGFSSKLSQIPSLVRALLIYNSNLWQCYFFNKSSNHLLVIVFHQSATGDIRENLDFAVDRQNRA